MSVWQVNTALDDGTFYTTIVLARTASDTGCLVGNLIRAAREVNMLEGDAGINQQSVHRLPDDFHNTAINQVFQAG